MARRAAFVSGLRERHPDTLLLDAGGYLFGRPLADQTEGRVVVDAMNYIGYDAAGVGGRDLAFGLETLRNRAAEANFPLVSANLVRQADGTLVFAPYQVLERAGRSVGVLGLASPEEVAAWARPADGLVALDPVETARRLVPELRERFDAVVVLSRLGLREDVALAGEVPGIDLIVGGRSGTPLRVPEVVPPDGTVLVQAYPYGEQVGLVSLRVSAGGRELVMGELVDLVVEQFEEDPVLAEMLAAAAEEAGLAVPTPAPPTALPPSPTYPEARPVYLAYFYYPSCPDCGRAARDLEEVGSIYPNLVVRSYDLHDSAAKALNEALSERLGVPEEKRLTAPMVFVGERFLLGDEVNRHELSRLVEAYAETGAPPASLPEAEPARAAEGIARRFLSLGAWTVAGAGLLDGLNPCAFTTLIFFVSYLSVTGRRGAEILLVGAAFTAAVFLAYFLVGLGMLRFVQALEIVPALGRLVYLATAGLCGGLAWLSFTDYRKAREGRLKDMTLQLPAVLKDRARGTIRRASRLRVFVVGAFAAGFAVALLELACTGQVYLPTIVFVMGVPELRAQAVLFLLLYNLAFVTPLVVVFGLVYFGTTSKDLTEVLRRRTATVKLLTSAFFAVLAVWLVVMVW